MYIPYQHEREHFFQPIVNTIGTVLNLPAAIWTLDEKKGTFKIIAGINLREKYIDEAYLQPSGPSIVAKVFRARKTIIVKDIAAEDRWKYKTEALKMGFKSAILAPIWTKKNILGVLTVYIPKNIDINLLQKEPAVEGFAAQIASTLRQIRSLEALNEVDRQINAEMQNPQELLKLIMESAQRVLECKHVSIFFLDKRTDELVRQVTSQSRLKRKKFKIGEGLVGFVFETKKSLLVPDVRDHPQFIPGLTSSTEKERSMVLAPIYLNGDSAGVISANIDELNGFDQHDLMILETLANQAAIALKNSRIFQQSKIFQEISRIINSSLDREQVVDSILEQLQKVIEYEGASIQIIQGEQRKLVGSRGSSIKKESSILHRNISQDPLISKTVKNKKPLVLSNVNNEKLWERLPATAHVNSWIGVPLIAENKVIGLLTIDHSKAGFYGKEEGEIAKTFASHVATALFNTNLFEQTQEQAQALAKLNELGKHLVTIEKSQDNRLLLEKIADDAKNVLNADLIELYEYNKHLNDYALPHISKGERREKVGKEKIYLDDPILELIHRKRPLYDINPQREGSIFTAPYRIVREDLPDKRFVFREDIKSTAVVPLRVGKDNVGLMFVNYRTPQEFPATQKELIELFAKQAAIAIKNTRLFRQITDHVAAIREWNNLSRGIVSLREHSPHTRNILEEIAASAQKVLKADIIDLYEYRQYREEQNRYELPPVSVGKLIDPSVQKNEIFEDDAVFKLIHRTKPLYEKESQNPESILRLPYSTPRENLPQQRFVVREDIKSTAVIPLRAKNESMGLLFANYRTPQIFDKDQRELIEFFANQAALAIRNARLYYYLTQRREALIGIAKRLATGIHLREEQIFKLIYEQALNNLGMRNFSIALYDEPTDTVRFVLASRKGELVDITKEDGWEPRRGAKGKTEDIIKRNKYLLLSTRNEVKKRGFSKRPGHKDSEDKIPNCWLGVPMRVGKKVIGVIANYHFGEDHFYRQDHIEILQALADLAAIAIVNSRLYYDQTNLFERQSALVEFSSQLGSKISSGESEIFKFIHKQAKKFMDTNNMYVAIYNEKNDMVSFPLIFENGKPINVESRRAGKGRTEEIIRTGEYIFINTKKENEEWYKQPGREEYTGKISASWIGVPMKLGDKIFGVVATYHPFQDNVYNTDDLKILQSMADIAAIAIDNARKIHELERAQTKIAESEAIITRTSIAADFVHRMNNLAGTIPIWVDQIRDYLGIEALKDKALSDFLDNIESNTDGLLRAAEQLKNPPQEQEINLLTVLESLKRQTRIHAPSNINVQLNAPNKLLKVRSVANELTNALWTLIENGIDAMPKGGILSIEAYLRENHGHHKWIEIQIKDSGKGIPEENLDKIFLPFFSTKHDPHVGYGLWRAKNIIERIKGEIGFISEEGKGTTFIIKLPVLLEG